MLYWNTETDKEYIKANNETLFVRDGKVYSAKPHIAGVCEVINWLPHVILKGERNE